MPCRRPSRPAIRSRSSSADGPDTKSQNASPLSWPGEEDLDAGRISVLTQVGAALIGLAEEHSIEWQGPTGGRLGLTVQRVHFQPERMAGLSA
ncbi:GreA/GreB family elongation factor [Microvirga sp. 2TAF3]|uniref:GreA/GreB family elongation factor n=1 Tax=Microvirga sp. 2TAF3 TaxID=3233014 RepID=UPI003F9DC37D